MHPTTRQTGEFPSVPVRQIGPYELLAELGQGSHAGVYLARRAGLERNFALKLMKHPEDAEGMRRFEREAQLAAKLDHPGIVAVVDFGRDPDTGAHYLVMDHVAGPSLEERLRAEGALDSAVAGELVAQLAEALATAHELGIVHRDLKPANILIDGRTGRPRISDFGLARQGLRTSLTAEGDLIGTPLYMSPEQVSSRPVDERSDVYALGVILYRLLTGEHPYVSRSLPALADLICEGNCRPPSAHVPGVDPAIERVCLHALSADPNQRPADAGQLALELRAALAGEGDRAGGEGPSRAAFMALVAVDVALILLLALALVQVLRLRREGGDLRAELADQEAKGETKESELARARQRLEDKEGELDALSSSVTRLQSELDAAQRRTREAQDQARRAAERARQAQLEARQRQQRAASASAAPRERPQLLAEVQRVTAGATRQEAEATIAALKDVPGAAAWRATLQKDLGQVPAAESTVAAALRAGARDPDLHVLRFQLSLLRSGGRLGSGPVQEALAALQKALPADSVQARYARLIQQRRVFQPEGIAELRELCKSAPKPYLLSTLATALTRSGPGSQLDRLKAAVEVWREALRADPYDSQAWFQLSYAYHSQWAMTKDASLTKPVLVTLARARALNPDPTLWTYTGKSYLTMVDLPHEAVIELEEALRRARERASAMHVQHAGAWLLVAYLRTGAEAKARDLAGELRRVGRPVARPIYQQLLGALLPPLRRQLQELYPPS